MSLSFSIVYNLPVSFLSFVNLYNIFISIFCQSDEELEFSEDSSQEDEDGDDKEDETEASQQRTPGGGKVERSLIIIIIIIIINSSYCYDA